MKSLSELFWKYCHQDTIFLDGQPYETSILSEIEFHKAVKENNQNIIKNIKKIRQRAFQINDGFAIYQVLDEIVEFIKLFNHPQR